MLAFLDRLSRVKEDNKRPFALEQHFRLLVTVCKYVLCVGVFV